jgi:uncharacterized protein (UPF0332 family)
MASYDVELLDVAQHLLVRRPNQRGKLPAARVRRSISTTYYALFHFLLDEASKRVIGTQNQLRRRRRTFVRLFAHAGMRTAFSKLRNQLVESSVEDIMRPGAQPGGPVVTPAFVREMAKCFADAQAKRTDADYDMNKPLSELDASLLLSRVEAAIGNWRTATSAQDKEFKHAVYLLMLMKGQIRLDK